MTSPADAQAIADLVREGMYSRDRAAQALGLAIESMSPGRAVLTMQVRADMLNGFDICHGGFITALADTAFAYACNSYNELTVASGLAVDFIAPAREGEVLTASAQEAALTGRTGVYDVLVTNARGERIAIFRGRSYRVKGKPSVHGTQPLQAR